MNFLELKYMYFTSISRVIFEKKIFFFDNINFDTFYKVITNYYIYI